MYSYMKPVLVIFFLLSAFSANAQTTTPDSTKITSLNEVVIGKPKALILQHLDGLEVNTRSSIFKSSNNLLDIFKRLPGLTTQPDGTLLMQNIPVTVLIDGKPTLMSAEALQQFLRNTRPEAIAGISLTQPSAKYDGEFKAIIDIKRKQDQTLGWKGELSTGWQQNNYSLSENNLQVMYKSHHFQHTLGVGYTRGTEIYRYNAWQHLASKEYQGTQTGLATNNNNLNIEWNTDFRPDTLNRFAVLFRAFDVNRPASSLNTVQTFDSTLQTTRDKTQTTNQTSPRQRNYTAQLSYGRKLGNADLQLVGAFSRIRNESAENMLNESLVYNKFIFNWLTALKNNIDIHTLQADYSSKRLDAGFRLAGTNTANDLRYDTLTTSGNWNVDSSRTNTFKYRELVVAAYISRRFEWEKWQLRIGLRVEYTGTKANAVTLSTVTNRSWLNWLPDIAAAWQQNEDTRLTIAASRRITRPNFDQLNPFRFYFSPLNYWEGNPLLRPAIMNKIGATYGRKAYQLSIYAGLEEHPLGRYPLYNPVTNNLAYLGTNFLSNTFAGAEINLPFTLTKWWKATINAGSSYKKDKIPYLDTTYAVPILEGSINTSQVFALPKGWTFDIYAYGRTWAGNSLYYIRPMGYIDLGLQKSWLNNKLQTKLNYYDITNSYVSSLIFRDKTVMDNRFRHWYGQRKVNFSIIYSFGSSIQPSKNNSKGEEERRAGM